MRADPRSLERDRAIVTAPLGVLKAGLAVRETGHLPRGSIRFEPPLPTSVRIAIARLGYGQALKVGLRFRSAFWPAVTARAEGSAITW